MKKNKLKEYTWTVEASGYLEAEDTKEAMKQLEKESENLVLDDKKYWRLHIDPKE